jgi:GalNAc5-diNAcBac-PP-undecaprenol beta-1,3-glucosyltransferase
MSFATVLIPTFDHGPLLGYAIDSVLMQTCQDFEIVVVGDGVPAQARPHVEAACAKDDRIRFVDRPKGARTGEPWRHEVLSKADSTIVCYVCDDDLWLPDHLEMVGQALENADFVKTWLLRIMPGGRVSARPPWDLGRPGHRTLLREYTNRIGLSCVAHRLDAYRRLPYGWRETPAGVATDRHMWLQWLETPQVRFACLLHLGVLGFPAVMRRDWTIEKRSAELAEWLQKLRSPAGLTEIRRRGLAQLLRVATQSEMALGNLRARLRSIAHLASEARSAPPLGEAALARIAELSTLEHFSFDDVEPRSSAPGSAGN